MIGGLVGQLEGVAPGLNLELDWRSLWLTSNSEYVIDLDDSAESFFYAWNELGWTFLEHFDIGLVAQRTRVFEQDLEVDRGLFVGWSGKVVGATLYLFNPDRGDPYLAFAIDLGF